MSWRALALQKTSPLYVGDVEHNHKLQRRMVWRSFETREGVPDSVFEENDIRRLEIGNRTRPAHFNR
jgi:hypothetical protein